MSRKVNIINNVINIAVTVIGVLAVLIVADRFYEESTGRVILFIAVGAVAGGFITAFVHEAGHLTFGKLNGFAFLSMTVWFFKWKKERGKTVFRLVRLGEEAGYTEMVPKTTENLEKRFKNMTLGGILFTVIPIVIGGIAFIFAGRISSAEFIITATMLPMGLYYLFGNALPMMNGGEGNDGKVLSDVRKNNDDAKVIMSLLKVQSGLFNGKTFSEIDEKYYFDLPQLPEDDMNFVRLLTARYCYFLDKHDYENAKKTTDRLLSIESLPDEEYLDIFKTYALYNYCTFDFDAEKADDTVTEIQKHLDKTNDPAEIRAKLAYILYVKKEKELVEDFYRKAVKEANKCNLSGQGLFERKLIEEMKKDF